MSTDAVTSPFDLNPPSLLNHRLGAEEVVVLYQMLLGRPPESIDVLDHHVRSGQTIDEFIRSLLASDEYASRECRHPVRRIDVEATPSQLERLRQQLRSVWTGYGLSDPHWSVITDEQYRADQIEVTEEAFYDSGAQEVEALQRFVDSYGVELPTMGRMADVGCGVGRVGEHLAQTFSAYCGVDISAPHLALAAERFAKRGLKNVELISLPDYLDGTQTYDFVYSLLTLQHSPPPLMIDLLGHMLATLKVGGIAVFQLPCAVASYEFVLADYLDGLADRDVMEMHALPQHVVEEVVAVSGCLLIGYSSHDNNSPNAVSRTYLVRKLT